MKPDWDELGEKYENSKKVLIGDVDCTVDDSKQLCEDQGVKGYPTLKYYVPGDPTGSVYEGDRSLDELKKFVKTLGPPCGPKHMSKCNEEQKETVKAYLATPVDELATKLAETEKELAEAEAAHDELLKGLQEQFKASDEKVKALKAKSDPEIKLMRLVVANLTETAAATVETSAAKAEL